MPDFECLKGNLKTDVLIVGGGIAGILCAHSLKEEGVEVALVEANKLCCKVTGNTTAKITSQHGLIYSKIAKRYGLERALLYLQLQENALGKYRDLCKRIDCCFEDKDSYVYARSSRAEIEAELAVLQQLGCDAYYSDGAQLPFSVAGAVCFPNQAQFHPLMFLGEIAKELNIYENTKVIELTPDGVRTNRGNIQAEKIVICTHFPLLNKHGAYFLKMYQSRSYVLALEQAAGVNGMYVGAEDNGLSLRNYEDILLLGGCSHRTGKSTGGWNELTVSARKLYPQCRIVGKWATQDCMTLDGIPYVGQYSKKTDNLYVATGFGKWGMTNAMAAATVLTDLLCGRRNAYEELLSPGRTMLHSQLLFNGFETVSSFITPTKPRCPHLGCALKWNAQERSWDCSCHGSRFGEDGELLDNPATDDLSFN